jgi:hypothetical protein
MSDTLAIWGAATGTIGTLTGVGGLALTAWRDRRDRRRGMLVTHGWQYAYDPDGNLLDAWVNVTAYNTGRRPLHIEYVGFEAMVLGDRKLAEDAGIDLPPENNLWVNKRFAITLNGETIEVAADGPSVKVWTRLVPMCLHGIDPTTTEFRGYVVTWPETFWWEKEPQPLLARPSQIHKTRDEVGSAVAALVIDQTLPEDMAPPFDAPGGVVGLQRLILDGDVERTSDLFPDASAPPDAEEAAPGS